MTRRRLNRLALAAAAPVSALFQSGCSSSGRKTIAVIPKGRAHQFWQSVHAGAAKAASENGVDIYWNGPATETDFNVQLQIVETMISRRVDAICLAPIDKKAMVAVVERAMKTGIPVVIFDSPIDTDQFTAQVATDNYAAGQAAARRMGELLGGKGKVVVVAVSAGAASTLAREAGFEETLAKRFPGIRIVDKRFGDADFAKSLRVAENMLTAFPDLDAMFASNESSTVGAVQALKSRSSKVKLVGFDFSPALENDLKSGVIDSLVVQHPFRMGQDAVLAAVRKLKGEVPDKIQNIEPRLVRREDLDIAEVRERLHPDIQRYLKSGG